MRLKKMTIARLTREHLDVKMETFTYMKQDVQPDGGQLYTFQKRDGCIH